MVDGNPTPGHFTVPAAFAPADPTAPQDSWSLTRTRTRTGPSSGHGASTVSSTEGGFDGSRGTIHRGAAAEINPLSH